MGVIFFILLFWVVPIFVAKKIGDGKGRTNGWVWGLLLGWIGVLVVALQSDQRHHLAAAAPGAALEATKTCPDCAEPVQAAARVCKHCGRRFDAQPVSV